MWLIAGLGNPGPEYEDTRHNLGFMALDVLAARWGISFSRQRGKADLGRGRIRGEEVLLAKPLRYMNRSGTVLGPLVRAEGLEVAKVLVLVDDMDLPLGTLRFRNSGGSAGHRGMDSVIRGLDSEDFPRIRLGIGRPAGGDENVSYVLSGFGPAEEPLVGLLLKTASDMVEKIISEGEMQPVTLRLEETEEEL